MIEIDEETVDRAIDDILGTDEPVRGEKTETAGDGQPEEAEKNRKTYLNRCWDCGSTFETPHAGGKYCPACRKRRISAGMKAGRAIRKEYEEARKAAASHSRKQPAANGRQMKTGDEDPVQEAWDELATEANTEASPPTEPEPPEREPEPTTGTMTADREDGAWGELSALYRATRDVARTIGADTSDVIEALFRMNAAMDYIWRKRGERA